MVSMIITAHQKVHMLFSRFLSATGAEGCPQDYWWDAPGWGGGEAKVIDNSEFSCFFKVWIPSNFEIKFQPTQ